MLICIYAKVILIRKLACHWLIEATHKNGTKKQKLNALLWPLAPSIHWASHSGGGPGATYQYIVFVLYFYCICGPAASYQWIPPLQSTALWRRWSPGWVINRLHIVKTADDQIIGSLKANRRVRIDHTNRVTLGSQASRWPLFSFQAQEMLDFDRCHRHHHHHQEIILMDNSGMKSCHPKALSRSLNYLVKICTTQPYILKAKKSANYAFSLKNLRKMCVNWNNKILQQECGNQPKS